MNKTRHGPIIIFSIILILLCLFGCSGEGGGNGDSTDVATKPDTIAPEEMGLSGEIVEELKANLQGTANSELSIRPDKSPSIYRLQTLTLSITSEQVAAISQAALDEVSAVNLEESDDLVQIMPLIIKGSQGSLTGVGINGQSEKIKTIQIIAKSVLTSLKGREQYLNHDSKQDSLTAIQTSLREISGAVIGNMDEAGINISNLSGASQKIMGSMIGSLDEGGIDTCDDLKHAIKAITAGATDALDSVSGVSVENLGQMIKSLTTGAVGALDDISIAGYSADNLGEMLMEVTAGVTSALDEIELAGYDFDNVASMITEITAGATNALVDINMDGFDSSDVEYLMIQIKNGINEELNKIEMAGFSDSDSDITVTDGINSGVNDKLDDPEIEGKNSAPGFDVSSASKDISETGDTATFTVKLRSWPTNDVTIAVSSSDTTEGSVDPTGFSFTEQNWNTNQTATITGIDDPQKDDDQEFTIVLGPADSMDSEYHGMDPADVPVTNLDDESPGFSVSAISSNTTEAGGIASFTIKLNCQPNADVTIGISSNDSSEGNVNPSSLTFTSDDWVTNQAVTVTGVDDFDFDGDQNYMIVLGVATSTDLNYQGINPADVSVTNTEDEAPLLPDTGQTTSRTYTFGEDHDYAINSPSYVDNNNGTVTDNNTGLVWQQSDDNEIRHWDPAVSYCQNLTLGSHSDWRLPNPKELQSIVDYGQREPAIDTAFFIGTESSDYWSSTTSVFDTLRAWYVDFTYGDLVSFYKINSWGMYARYVRCVRGGSESNIWTFDFLNIGGNVISHGSTKLMWQKDPGSTTRNWKQAVTYCEEESTGGYTDWRLPNIKELQSIVDFELFQPSINATYFPNTEPSGYWSSTPCACSLAMAWYLDFSAGGVFGYFTKDQRYVRCVRGGQ